MNKEQFLSQKRYGVIDRGDYSVILTSMKDPVDIRDTKGAVKLDKDNNPLWYLPLELLFEDGRTMVLNAISYQLDKYVTQLILQFPQLKGLTAYEIFLSIIEQAVPVDLYIRYVANKENPNAPYRNFYFYNPAMQTVTIEATEEEHTEVAATTDEEEGEEF